MALCIMSKCGEERCGDRFFREREAGTGRYGFMHNVEVCGKWVCGGGLKRRGVRVAMKWVWEGAG
jgi:hypothetical protein